MTQDVHPVIRQLAALRADLGMSSTFAGEAAGFSRATLWRWETGACSPILDDLSHYAASFGMELTLRQIPLAGCEADTTPTPNGDQQ